VKENKKLNKTLWPNMAVPARFYLYIFRWRNNVWLRRWLWL